MAIEDHVEYHSALEECEEEILRELYTQDIDNMRKHWNNREIFLTPVDEIESNNYETLITINHLNREKRNVHGIKNKEEMEIDELMTFHDSRDHSNFSL